MGGRSGLGDVCQHFEAKLVETYPPAELAPGRGGPPPRRAGDPGWYDKPRVARLDRPSAVERCPCTRSVCVVRPRPRQPLAGSRSGSRLRQPGRRRSGRSTCATWSNVCGIMFCRVRLGDSIRSCATLLAFICSGGDEGNRKTSKIVQSTPLGNCVDRESYTLSTYIEHFAIVLTCPCVL